MSLNEIKKLNNTKTVGLYKQHWKSETLPEHLTSMPKHQIKLLLEKGSYGCWFQPKNKWSSILWLELNNYKSIADRIRVLNQIYGVRKRYIVFETERKTLMLAHVDTRQLLEF